MVGQRVMLRNCKEGEQPKEGVIRSSCGKGQWQVQWLDPAAADPLAPSLGVISKHGSISLTAYIPPQQALPGNAEGDDAEDVLGCLDMAADAADEDDPAAEDDDAQDVLGRFDMAADAADEDEDDPEVVQALVDLHLNVNALDVPALQAAMPLVTNAELVAEVHALVETLKNQFRPFISSAKEWLACELVHDSNRDDDPDFILTEAEELAFDEMLSDDSDDAEDYSTPDAINTTVEDDYQGFQCPCGCKANFFDSDLFRLMRQCRNLKQRKLRELVQGILLSCTRLESMEGEEENLKRKMRRQCIHGPHEAITVGNLHTFYHLFNVEVCKHFFMFVTGAGIKMLKNIHTDQHTQQFVAGAERRGHLVTSEVALHGRRLRLALKWLKSFASREALPNPDGRGGTADEPPMLFSPTFTKILIHQQYVAAASAGGDPDYTHIPIAISTFCILWKKKCNHYKIMTKRTDFCDTCTDLRSKHLRDELAAHLLRVTSQREFVYEQLRLANLSYMNADESMWCAFLSFDFCEKARVPIFIDQPKHYYFMAGLGVDIFGIYDDLRLQQSNYLLPEGHFYAEKGINVIGAIFLHRLSTNAEDKRASTLMLLSDNCAAQNKCMYTVWFFSWWAMVASSYGSNNKVIEHNFAIAGHTKFGPDRGFALIKNALKKQAVFAPADLYHVVQCLSGRTNSAVCSTQYPFYNWKLFLLQFFKAKVKLISLQHHFRYSSDNAGVVQHKTYPEKPWQTTHLLQDGVSVADVLNAGKEGSRFYALSKFALGPTPITAKRLKACQEVVTKYSGFLGDGKRYYSPCTF